MESKKRREKRQKYPNIWVRMELTDGDDLCSRKADWGGKRGLNQIQGCGIK